MTELENKAREYSIVYDTKYAEDDVLEEMLSRPQDFVDGAIMGVVQLLRQKASRDGFISGAEAMQEENEQLNLIRHSIELQKQKQEMECNKMSSTIIEELQKENKQLKQQIKKLKEEKQYETCPYRSTDMGCDYCDYRDRDLKDGVEE